MHQNTSLQSLTNPLPKESDLIITADTIVVLGTTILEKPTSPENAFEMLSSLSGRKHNVFTAVCLLLPKVKDSNDPTNPFIKSFVEETEVEFTKWVTPEMISSYVETGSPLDKAGGYGIQDGTGGSFISRIKGCYFNVTGFPINRFCLELLQLIQDGKLWTFQIMEVRIENQKPSSVLFINLEKKE